MLMTINNAAGKWGLSIAPDPPSSTRVSKSGSPATVQSMCEQNRQLGTPMPSGVEHDGLRRGTETGRLWRDTCLIKGLEIFDFVSCSNSAMVVEGARSTLTSARLH